MLSTAPLPLMTHHQGRHDSMNANSATAGEANISPERGDLRSPGEILESELVYVAEPIPTRSKAI